MDKRKLSASQVTSLLVYKADNLEKGFPPYEVLQEGKIIHARLGYAQTKIFIRYFPYKVDGKIEWWSIGGMPDRLDIENGIVEELKTFKLEQTKIMQERAGLIQCNIYCWLTGFTRWRLLFYDISRGQIAETKEGKFDKAKLYQDLQLAIQLQKRLEEFARDFREIASQNSTLSRRKEVNK